MNLLTSLASIYKDTIFAKDAIKRPSDCPTMQLLALYNIRVCRICTDLFSFYVFLWWKLCWGSYDARVICEHREQPESVADKVVNCINWLESPGSKFVSTRAAVADTSRCECFGEILHFTFYISVENVPILWLFFVQHFLLIGWFGKQLLWQAKHSPVGILYYYSTTRLDTHFAGPLQGRRLSWP